MSGGFGANRGGRGGFSQQADDQEGGSFRGGFGGNRGGRGGFNQQNDQETESSRGGFSSNRGGRGGFNQQNDQDSGNSRGGFGANRGGRGGFNQQSDDQEGGSFRGGFGGNRGGRGGFNQQNDQDSGNSRGGFNQQSDQEGGSFRGGFGGNRGGRGGFSQQQSDQDSGNSRGGFGGNRGGRGGFNQQNDQETESSRGGFSSNRGGRGGFNQQSDQDAGNSRGGFGANRGGRGGFSQQQSDQDSGNSRGGFGGNRGGFSQQSDQDSGNSRGGFTNNRSGRGGFNQQSDQEGGTFRGGFGGNRGGRGGFNQQNDQETESSRGGFTSNRGGRGGFNQQNDQDSGNSRGGFGGNRGGRGGFNQQSDDQEGGNSRGGFGGNRGGRGGFNQQQSDQDGYSRPARDENDDKERGNEATPAGYVPKARNVDELYREDVECEKAYADVVDNDEDVAVENFTNEIIRIQTWEEAEFNPQLVKNVKERAKYLRPRKIQCATIPFVLDGFDIKSQAETGSGKTAAFLLPILDACMRGKAAETFKSELGTPFAIIIGPTRELVLQVFEQAEKFAADTGVSVAKAYGQYHIGQNHAEIRRGCDILCGTPGRLKQFITNGEVLVNKLQFLVLDEADRLLDDSFKYDIDAIVSTPTFPSIENRQTLLFSATFSPEVIAAANVLMRPDAVFITNKRNNPNKRIKQMFIEVPNATKLQKLADLLKAEAEKAGGGSKIRRTLVFVNTKRMSDMAALFLCQQGLPATSINGDRGQHLREQALSDFRTHKASVLVSTDVCARGLDIKELDHVINMDMPTDAVTYVHRIGRTGRISEGASTSFVSPGEPLLQDIAELMRGKNEEVPPSLEEILKGNGSSFSGANNVPLGKPMNSNAQTKGNAGDKEQEEW